MCVLRWGRCLGRWSRGSLARCPTPLRKVCGGSTGRGTYLDYAPRLNAPRKDFLETWLRRLALDSPSMTDDVRGDLRSYYEEEARQGLRGPLKGGRAAVRRKFIAVLHAEARTSVVDFGSGPGRDAHGFLDEGIAYIGVDLAHGNGVLAAERGITVVHGSIDAPPFAPASFDAGWSMSTLMHLPTTEVPAALQAMVRTLRPGAPLWIGQWGGGMGEHVDDEHIEGERRLFSLRSFEQNRELLGAVATVEHGEIWPVDPAGWEYHMFHLRVPSGPSESGTA